MTSHQNLYPSAIEAIGNTPLIDLARITHNIDGRILAKLEYFNPGFSKKDRIARQIIADAEASGELSPGQTVVELTSGNTGTGLAIVCGIRGYPFVAVMSKGNSIERARMMSALGAEVILVDQLPTSISGQVTGGDLALVQKETRRIVAQRNAFRADQFQLESNFRAHYLNTGPEIIQQSAGQIDVFCDFAGTGGSFAGCSAAFKEHNQAIACFIVEPEGAAILSGEPVTYPNHRIQGGGYAMENLVMLKPEHIDGYVKISDEKAIAMTRRLAKEEGIFAGFSSGANVAAAIHLLKGDYMGNTAVVLICDSGLKYLSTDLWE
jgi:cysteine synthase A